jgi:8-oxo-dGTP diphosphatase
MPHLHTQPDGHDLTASAFVFRERGPDVEVLVHLHRKLGVLLQPGGHVEPTENPWQALEHELREETGYALDQLRVLQPLRPVEDLAHDNPHPLPAFVNTHEIGTGHFHTDLVFALLADEAPRHPLAAGESPDLRWLTADALAADPAAPDDVATVVRMLVRDVVPVWHRIPSTAWSLETRRRRP